MLRWGVGGWGIGGGWGGWIRSTYDRFSIIIIFAPTLFFFFLVVGDVFQISQLGPRVG